MPHFPFRSALVLLHPETDKAIEEKARYIELARNKDEGRSYHYWPWAGVTWFLVPCSAEDPATFTTEETSGHYSCGLL